MGHVTGGYPRGAVETPEKMVGHPGPGGPPSPWRIFGSGGCSVRNPLQVDRSFGGRYLWMLRFMELRRGRPDGCPSGTRLPTRFPGVPETGFPQGLALRGQRSSLSLPAPARADADWGLGVPLVLRGNSWSQFTTHPGATAVSEDLTMTILSAYVGAVFSSITGGYPQVPQTGRTI